MPLSNPSQASLSQAWLRLSRALLLVAISVISLGLLKISSPLGDLEPKKGTELPPSERKPENSSHDLYPHFPLLEDSDDQVPRLLPDYFKTRSYFAKLYGWILTEEDVKEIIPKLKNINKKDHMSVLVEHFREKFPENKDKLLSMTNLERREYLSTALNQYTEKEYYLSITALILQAEGICKDRVTQSIQESISIPKQISIFNRRGRENLLELSKRNLINIPKTEFEILEISRSSDNQSKLPPNFDGLNRHKIAHGDFHPYGTEVNNLKAISLLLWIYDVC